MMKKTVSVLAFVAAGLLAGSVLATMTHTAATIDTRADLLAEFLPDDTPVKLEVNDDGQLVIVLSTNITGGITLPADLGPVAIDLNGWSITGTNGVDGTETTFGGAGGAAVTVKGTSGAGAGQTAITVKNEPSTQLWENGPYFATCNVGAAEPQQSGWYFWWGDTVGYTHDGSKWVSVKDGTTIIEFNNSNYPSWTNVGKTPAQLKETGYIDDESNPFLNAAHDAATVNLGAPWRMMTVAEVAKLTDTEFCTRTLTDNYKGTGIGGYIVKGAKAPYTNNEIFLPFSGYGDGSILDDPGFGYTYSSMADVGDNNNANCLKFGPPNVFEPHSYGRGNGFSVRAVNPNGTRAPSGAGPAEIVGGNGGYGCGKGGEPIVGADGNPYPVEGGEEFLKKGKDGKGSVVITSDEMDGLAFDTRRDAVRKPVTQDEILPFAWNDDLGWPTDGTGAGLATVSVVPMAGTDATKPATWTVDGPERTFVTASGEGTNDWTRYYKKLYKATVMHRQGETEVAYFDLAALELPEDPADILKEQFGDDAEIAVDADGNPIVILKKDIDGSLTIPADLGPVTIDLNGWTITGTEGTEGDKTTAGGTGNAAITVTGAGGAGAGTTTIAVKDERGTQLWAGGPYFATCNIGATSPEEFGWYFWWGDTVGYTNNGSAWISAKDGTIIQFKDADPANRTCKQTEDQLRTAGWIDASKNLVAKYDAAMVHLGGSWRMMTHEELAKLTDTAFCTRMWTDDYKGTGVKGYIVKGAQAPYTNNEVFFPLSGRGQDNGFKATDHGFSWGSTFSPEAQLNKNYAWCLFFDGSTFYAYDGIQANRGLPVRAVSSIGSRPASGTGPGAITGGKGGNGNPPGEGADGIVGAEVTGGQDLVKKGNRGLSYSTITINRVQQRYPWNGMVDIDYTLKDVDHPENYHVQFTVTTGDVTFVMHEMLDASTLINASNGTYRVTWIASADGTTFQDCVKIFAKNAEFKAQVVYDGGDKSQTGIPVATSAAVVADLDTRADAVRKPATVDEILPFAWNDDLSWPTNGTGVGMATVSVVPVDGAGTNPAAWTNAGPVRTFVTASGEGTNAWDRYYKKLYKATITHRLGDVEVAYFDLTGLDLPKDPVDILKEAFGEDAEITLDANGDPTVILDRNITEGVTLPTDLGSITIDLNGWTLSGTAGEDGTTTSAGGNGGVAITVDGTRGVTAGTTAITVKDERDYCVQLWENGPYFSGRNVGATKPEKNGYYFWWGDTVGYTNNGSGWISVKDGTTPIHFAKTEAGIMTYGKTKTALRAGGWIDDSGCLAPGCDAATVNWGEPWRMMTSDELKILTNETYCARKWTTDWKGTGKKGWVITGKTPGYTDKSVFFLAAGSGSGDEVKDLNSHGNYWTSMPVENIKAVILNFYSSKFYWWEDPRYMGNSIRPVRDTPSTRPASGAGPAELSGGKGGDGNPAGKGSLAIVDGTGAAYSEITDPSGLVTKGVDGMTLLPDVTAETAFTYDGTEKRPVAATNVYDFAGTVCATNAGNYTVRIKPAEGYAWGDGSTTTTNIAWTVATVPVTITFTAADKNFDRTAAATCTATNFANVVSGEAFALDTSAMTFAFEDEKVGTDKIVTATGYSLDKVIPLGDALKANYTFSFTDTATASIKAQPIDEIEMQPVTGTFTYNGAGHEPEPGVTNTALNVMLEKGTDFDYAYESNTNAGTAKVIANLKGNYSGALTNTFAIGRAAATVKADDKGKTYGGADPELTATVTGTFGGDALVYTVTREAGDDVRTYTITASGAKVQGNYDVAYQTGTFTITAKGIPVPTAETDLVYDGTEQEGVAEGEGYTVVNGKQRDAGSYTAVATLDGNHKWDDDTTEPKSIAWSIAKMSVTVSGKDVQKAHGTDDPAAVREVTFDKDLVAGDSIEYQVTREPGEEITVGETATRGPYAIYVTAAPDQGNYSVSTQNGTLNILDRDIKAKAENIVLVYNGTKVQPKVEVQSPGLTSTNITFCWGAGDWRAEAPTFQNVIPTLDHRTNVLYRVEATDAVGALTPLEGTIVVAILPREITLTMGNGNHQELAKQKVYDGTPLWGTKEDIQVGGNGYAPGEEFTYGWFTNRTVVGINPSSFDWHDNPDAKGEGDNPDGTLVSNYSVTPEYGWLKILPPENAVTIYSEVALWEYDGNYHPYDEAETNLYYRWWVDEASQKILDANGDKVVVDWKYAKLVTKGLALNDFDFTIVHKEDGADVTSSYAGKAIKAAGTFEMKNGTIADGTDVAGHSVDIIYNGQATNAWVEVRNAMIGNPRIVYSTDKATWSTTVPKFTHATAGAVPVWYAIEAANFNAFTNPVPLTVNIRPRPVEFESMDITAKLGEAPIPSPDHPLVVVTNVIGGTTYPVVPGDVFAFTATNTLSSVGTAPASFRWDAVDPTVASDYAVTLKYGRLIVASDLELVIRAKSREFTFNGVTNVCHEAEVVSCADGDTVTLVNLFFTDDSCIYLPTKGDEYRPNMLTNAEYTSSATYSRVRYVSGKLTMKPETFKDTDITVVTTNVTYDGKFHKATVTTTVPGASVAYNTTGRDAVYVTEAPTFRNADSKGYPVYYEVTATGYEPYYGMTAVTINPRPLVLYSVSATNVYDGAEHTTSNRADTVWAAEPVGETGLVGGDTLASARTVPVLENAAQIPNTFVFEIANAAFPGEDLAANYSVIPEPGVLVVEPYSFTLTLTVNDKLYDGTTDATYKTNNLADLELPVPGDGNATAKGVLTLDWTQIGDQLTFAFKNPTEGTWPVTNNTFKDAWIVTNRAGVVRNNYALGAVTVNPATIGKRSISPEDDPDFGYPKPGVDPTDPQAITNSAIPFSVFDTTNTYDGAAHTIDTNRLEASYTPEMFLGNVPSFGYALTSNGTYTATAPAFVDATVTSLWFKVMVPNFADIIHPAKVIVKKRAVTLTSADDSWTYDRNAHSNMTVAVSGEGFIAGQGVATNNFATITNVGTTPNSFDFDFITGTKPENYTVSCVPGTLEITKGDKPQDNDPEQGFPKGNPEDPEEKNDPSVRFSAFDYTNAYDGVSHTIKTNDLVEAYTTWFAEDVTVTYGVASNGAVWVENAFALTDVGVTSFWYKVSSADYADVIRPCKVTVTPRPVTLTSADGSWKYDRNAHSNMTVTVGGEGFVAHEGVTTNDFATITNVGETPNSFAFDFIEGTKAANYALSCVTGRLEVVKGDKPTKDDPEQGFPKGDPEDPGKKGDPSVRFSAFDYTNAYDAVEHTIDTNALFEAYTNWFDEAVTVTYGATSNGAVWVENAFALTDAGVTSFWYKVESADYADVIRPCKVAVKQRPVTLTSADGSWKYDRNAHSNMTVTVSGDGFVAGQGVTTNDFATITEVGTKLNTFGYAFLPGTKPGNYAISCVKGTLTITKGDKPTGDDPEQGFPKGDPEDEDDRNDPSLRFSKYDYTNSYDGVEHSIDEETLKTDYETWFEESVTVKYGVTSNAVAWADEPFVLVNVGVTSFWYKVTSADYADVIRPCKVTVTPRPVTLTSADGKWTYDRNAHSNMTITVGGEGFVQHEGVTTNDFATITNVGETPNSFTFAFDGNTEASNYALSCVTGTLKVVSAKIDPEDDPDKGYPKPGTDPEDPADISDPTIAFSAFDTTNVYDAAEHTIDTNRLETAYADKFLGNVPSFGYALTSNGTYAATAPAFVDATVTSLWFKVSADNFEDVIHPAKVIVNKRPVTLKSADDSWKYDRNAHSNVTVTVEGEYGFVAGQGVTTNDFATITNVGETPNSFTYALIDGTKAANYALNCVTGKLEVVKGDMPEDDDPEEGYPQGDPEDEDDKNDPSVRFSKYDYTNAYDGVEHTIDTNALKAAYATWFAEDVTVTYGATSNGAEWVENAFALTDVGVTSFWYKVESADYADVIRPCKVAVTPRAVTLVSGSHEWTYDTKPHAYTNLTVTGFVAGEGLATTSDWATITNVGTNDNTFAYTLIEGTKPENYALSCVTGKISVVKSDRPVGDDPEDGFPQGDPEDPAAKADPSVRFSKYDYTNAYDGAWHTIDTNALLEAYAGWFQEPLTVTYGAASNGTEWVDEAFALRDVGVTSFWYKVTSDNYADLIRPCKVTVTPRAVTLESGTQEFIYNGRAHSNMTVTVVSGGFVAGEGISTNDFATITDVGTNDNTFAYAPVDEGTRLSNYDIAVVTGRISVVKSGAQEELERAFEPNAYVEPVTDDDGNVTNYTVVVTNDITGPVTVNEPVTEFIIDLEGHTIVGTNGVDGTEKTYGTPGGPAIVIPNGATVAVKDSTGDEGRIIGGNGGSGNPPADGGYPIADKDGNRANYSADPEKLAQDGEKGERWGETTVVIHKLLPLAPWNGKILVTYEAFGLVPGVQYKVDFIVTVKGVTKTAQPPAEDVVNGVHTWIVDGDALFGPNVVDEKAHMHIELVPVANLE